MSLPGQCIIAMSTGTISALPGSPCNTPGTPLTRQLKVSKEAQVGQRGVPR